MARNRKSWNGNEWKKRKGSSFDGGKRQSNCDRENPTHKTYKDSHGSAPSVKGGKDFTGLQQDRSANDDNATNYKHDIRKYDPFDYRIDGDGEDARPTSFDKSLAQEPSNMDNLDLPPIKGAEILRDWMNHYCMTKHEGRKWVYSPESLSHYYSLWKRYQKALTLQPQAVVEDPLGESVYRFFSGNSRFGYWDVKVGTLTEGAASITSLAEILSFCDPIITIEAEIQPSTAVATWVQVSGEVIPFLVSNGGRTVLLFRTSQVGPFVFEGTIGGVNPLSVTVTIRTSPRDLPLITIPQNLKFFQSAITNVTKRAESVSGCNGYLKLQNSLNILFDAPARDSAYVATYVLEQLIGDTWTAVQTNSNPSLREFEGVVADAYHRIVTSFDIFTRTFTSTSTKFFFVGNTLDIYLSNCAALYGNNGSSSFIRATAVIKRNVEPPFALYGTNGRGSYNRATASVKRVEETTLPLYGNKGQGSYIRTDYTGTIIG